MVKSSSVGQPVDQPRDLSAETTGAQAGATSATTQQSALAKDKALGQLRQWAIPPVGALTPEADNRFGARETFCNTIVNTLETASKANATDHVSLNLDRWSGSHAPGPLPEALITLLQLHPNIKELKLANHDKASFPDNIFDLPKDFKIDLSGAQLRYAVLKDLHARMQDPNYAGPRFENLPQLPATLTADDLRADLASWSAEAPKPTLVDARKKFGNVIVENFQKRLTYYDEHSSLTKTETELQNLRNAIEQISFQGFGCDTVPQEIYLLPELRSVVLTNNQLTKLPEGFFKNLQSVELLYLTDNRITELSGIASASNLQTLFLKGNRLSAIPEGLAGLTKLTDLNLALNPILEVDTAELPPNVEIVNLARTKPGRKIPEVATMVSFKATAGQLPKLQMLDLSGNVGLTDETISHNILRLGPREQNPAEKPPTLNLKGTGLNTEAQFRAFEKSAQPDTSSDQPATTAQPATGINTADKFEASEESAQPDSFCDQPASGNSQPQLTPYPIKSLRFDPSVQA